MRVNLDTLQTQLYCAISNWNDFTESQTGERLLTDAQVSAQADMAFDTISDNLYEEGIL